MRIKSNENCPCGSDKIYKNCCMKNPDLLLKKLNITPVKYGEFLVTPKRIIPPFIIKPSYANTGKPPQKPRLATPCTPEVILKMRSTCQAATRVLHKVLAAAKIGTTTDELDAIAHEATILENAYPSPLNYHGFPKSCCTSVNNIICHGIPDKRPLKNGDILNVDITIFKDGVHGDTNATICIGEVSPEVKDLVDTAKLALEVGIAAVKPGIKVFEIGKAIEKVVLPKGYSIVETFCGHGIGEEFHDSLYIPHYFDSYHKETIREGMIFTIEPMINMGTKKEKIWKDAWTASTLDLLPSAQFEHTILVTSTGCEILTKN